MRLTLDLAHRQLCSFFLRKCVASSDCGSPIVMSAWTWRISRLLTTSTHADCRHDQQRPVLHDFLRGSGRGQALVPHSQPQHLPQQLFLSRRRPQGGGPRCPGHSEKQPLFPGRYAPALQTVLGSLQQSDEEALGRHPAWIPGPWSLSRLEQITTARRLTQRQLPTALEAGSGRAGGQQGLASWLTEGPPAAVSSNDTENSRSPFLSLSGHQSCYGSPTFMTSTNSSHLSKAPLRYHHPGNRASTYKLRGAQMAVLGALTSCQSSTATPTHTGSFRSSPGPPVCVSVCSSNS